MFVLSIDFILYKLNCILSFLIIILFLAGIMFIYFIVSMGVINSCYPFNLSSLYIIFHLSVVIFANSYFHEYFVLQHFVTFVVKYFINCCEKKHFDNNLMFREGRDKLVCVYISICGFNLSV